VAASDSSSTSMILPVLDEVPEARVAVSCIISDTHSTTFSIFWSDFGSEEIPAPLETTADFGWGESSS